MIRFVDLTRAYWTMGGPPCCAFMNTVTDRFLEQDGRHLVDDPSDLELIDPEYRERCKALVPEGFWTTDVAYDDGVTWRDIADFQATAKDVATAERDEARTQTDRLAAAALPIPYLVDRVRAIVAEHYPDGGNADPAYEGKRSATAALVRQACELRDALVNAGVRADRAEQPKRLK